MQKSEAKNINAVALEYMEEKYGEKFEYAAPFGNSMTGTHELMVKCAGFPSESILVRIENYKRDNKSFLDNYLAVKYKEETIAFLKSCAVQVFGEGNIIYEVNTLALSPDLGINATFEEYLADTYVPLHILVEVKESNYSSKEQAQQYAELVAANGSEFYLTILFVHDSDYGLVDREAFNRQITSKNYAYCAKATRFSGKIELWWLEEE